MKKIVLFLITSILFTVVLLSVKNSYSAYTKRVQTSLEVTTPKLEAVFLTGRDFNAKIKQLAGNNEVTYATEDNNITSIVRSNILTITPTADNVVSDSDSSFPIYAWYDSGVLYYYTEVEHPKTNNFAKNMFRGLSNLIFIDISTVDTSSTTDFDGMFYLDGSIETLNLSNFNTNNAEYMGGMFYNCTSLKVLNVSSFNTSNVTQMHLMFYGLSSLQSLDLSGFNLSNLNRNEDMLTGLTNLKELKTPKVYPNDTSVVITLPKTMYDENIVEYISLGKSTNPTSPIETIIREGYTVTFDADGGSVNPSTKIVRYSGNYGNLPTPTKTGYTFLGWNGKNLFSNDFITYTTYTTINGNSITFDASSVQNNYGTQFELWAYNADAVKCLGSSLTSDSIIFTKDSTFDKLIFKIWGSLAEPSITIVTNLENGKTYTFSYEVVSSDISQTKAVINNIQLKEENGYTEYEPYYITSDTSIVQNENHTLKAIWQDVEAPTLSLSKITYKEGFDGWSFNNSYVDDNGVLILGENGQAGSAGSDYCIVNKEQYYVTFEAWTNSSSANFNPNGGILLGQSYYDMNGNLTPDTSSGQNYMGNGWASPLELNKWTELTVWYGMDIYGFDKTTYTITTGAEGYSEPITKVRNFRFWGSAIPSNFYYINVTSSDNEGVVETKYAKGSQNKAYFESNGKIVTNNEITVNENGVYTVFVRDAMGNSTIQTIEITNIVSSPWNFSYNGTDGTDGKGQLFTVPATGTYKLETWGAQGGNLDTTRIGGYGGYSTGNIHLDKGQKIYVYVGGQGKTVSGVQVAALGGYNGGGSAVTSINNAECLSSSGGGATHISTSSNLLQNLDNNIPSILIVSGGGSGYYYDPMATSWGTREVGHGGGYIGTTASSYVGSFSGYVTAVGGSQSSGYAFGVGYSCGIGAECSGGGGGFYGGTGSAFTGGGGSGYLKSTLSNKSMYCYNCSEDLTNTTTFTVSTTGSTAYKDTAACPYGYSSSPVSKCAKAGSGYARITLISVD